MKKLTHYQVDTAEIVIPENRVRKEFDKEKLVKLAESFTRTGQLQPGVCTRGGDGRLVLVAGERRYRAAQLAKLPYLFVLKEEADETMLLEIELEENLNRENLTWQEEDIGLKRLKELRDAQRKKEGDNYTIRDQARETERSIGTLQESLERAEFIEHFEEVRNAPTRSEANKVIKKIKQMVVRAKLLEQATQLVESKAVREGATISLEVAGTGGKTISVGGREIAADRIIDLGRRVIHGEMETALEQFKDESVQIMLFDPPWGVELQDSREGMERGSAAHQVAFEDSKESFLEQLPKWLGRLYGKMAPESHLYMFFGIVHYQFIYDTLRAIGFQVNGMPIYWIKQGQHWTRNPEVWPGRAVEPIAFARKGKKLLQRTAGDYILTSVPTARIKQIHPSAKHPDVYLDILKRSAAPGDTVLDPMAGSGMAGVAADALSTTHKLDWWLIEKEKPFRDLALENCFKGYSQIVLAKDTAVETENREREIDTANARLDDRAAKMSHGELEALRSGTDAMSFRELQVGSPAWRSHWRMFPEVQDQMLKWAKEHGA